jgi:hypothetical protein
MFELQQFLVLSVCRMIAMNAPILFIKTSVRGMLDTTFETTRTQGANAPHTRIIRLIWSACSFLAKRSSFV